MEDTKSLLMMVLQKVFHNRPKIVEETFQLIYNYNNGKREKREYERTLKTICDLMDGELSSQILVYLLTMVDMPKEGGCQLPIMEKMQKTHGCLAESVRPHLLDCLKNRKLDLYETSIPVDKDKIICSARKTEVNKNLKYLKKENITKRSSSSDDDSSIKSIKRPKKSKRRACRRAHSEDQNEPKDVASLTQICSIYCTSNEIKLKELYKTKLGRAWKMLYKQALDEQTTNKIYEVIRYLNRMMKLVRMIEDNDVTTEIIKEEYPDIEILARLRHKQEFVDPFDEIDKCLEKLRAD